MRIEPGDIVEVVGGIAICVGHSLKYSKQLSPKLNWIIRPPVTYTGESYCYRGSHPDADWYPTDEFVAQCKFLYHVELSDDEVAIDAV